MGGEIHSDEKKETKEVKTETPEVKPEEKPVEKAKTSNKAVLGNKEGE